LTKLNWKHFDNWWVKVVAFVLIIGSVWWMVYAIQWHYRLSHLCKCPVDWEYLPFAVGSLFIIFCLALLSKKLTEGAAAVVLPFAQLIIERFGKKDVVSMKVTPPAPGQPPAGTVVVTPSITPAPSDLGDKP
jgi:hypothetical protein